MDNNYKYYVFWAPSFRSTTALGYSHICDEYRATRLGYHDLKLFQQVRLQFRNFSYWFDPAANCYNIDWLDLVHLVGVESNASFDGMAWYGSTLRAKNVK